MTHGDGSRWRTVADDATVMAGADPVPARVSLGTGRGNRHGRVEPGRVAAAHRGFAGSRRFR